jgi:L-lactate dehydrogenase
MSSSPQIQTKKVAVIGAVTVGATFVYSLMIGGLASEIILADIDKQREKGEAMDITHALRFSGKDLLKWL